jgi:dGTPase
MMAGPRLPPRVEPTIAPLENPPIFPDHPHYSGHPEVPGEPSVAPPVPPAKRSAEPPAPLSSAPSVPSADPASAAAARLSPGLNAGLSSYGRPRDPRVAPAAARPAPFVPPVPPAAPAPAAPRVPTLSPEPASRASTFAPEPSSRAPSFSPEAPMLAPAVSSPQQDAPYAADPLASRGRRHAEPSPQGRSHFQRDRDRIIHANAFRRLEYKTQVFINHEGDLFRTRLTHTLEVAQIARSVARTLRLNEDLAEAISLAHDLGHTPFGHAGQDELHACMREHAPDAGGFEHNFQSLRIVDELEERYAAFDGLNLCFETREGILKHCSLERARTLGDVGERFLNRTQPSLEAQLANLSDEIAYNNHDIDDGLRSGLITLAQMRDVPIFARHHAEVLRLYPQVTERRAITETIRRMINTLIIDLTQTTAARIAAYAPRSIDDVRSSPPLVAFSDNVRAEADVLKVFLRDKLYRHYQVTRVMNKAKRVVRELFQAFLDEPRLLPPQYQRDEDNAQARAIADYIAGMTDRYAIREHRKLFRVGED